VIAYAFEANNGKHLITNKTQFTVHGPITICVENAGSLKATQHC
jgi:hypothetical protein